MIGPNSHILNPNFQMPKPTFGKCEINPDFIKSHELVFLLNKHKNYAVPKSLIPQVLPYDSFNKSSVKKNYMVYVQIFESGVSVLLFKVKLFNSKEKAEAYAKKRGHKKVYDLPQCSVM